MHSDNGVLIGATFTMFILVGFFMFTYQSYDKIELHQYNTVKIAELEKEIDELNMQVNVFEKTKSIVCEYKTPTFMMLVLGFFIGVLASIYLGFLMFGDIIKEGWQQKKNTKKNTIKKS